jgi:PAS domain S-box-containing protein
MLQFLRSNKNILVVALGIFIVSMTSLMFFLNTQNQTEVSHETKADVLDSVMVHSHYNEEKAIREELGNNDDAVVVIGIDGKINFASWDYEKITGLSPDDLEEQLFFSYVHPEDLAIIFGAFGKVIESGKATTMVGPYRVLTNEGEYKVNMASLYPLKENEKVNRIAITVKEISQEMLEHPEQPAKVLPVKIKNPTTPTTKTVKHNTVEKNEPEAEVKIESAPQPEHNTHKDEGIIKAKQYENSPEKEPVIEKQETKTKPTEEKKSSQNGPTLKGYKEKASTPHNEKGTPLWIMSDEMAFIKKI